MATPGNFSDDRDRVRDASDIVRIIGEHLHLKPKGREYVGLCPFHDDHKPSMNVVPQKQIFHCFSCGAGGDVFTFVQRFHKMEFREALEYLAERAGIALTRRGRREDADGEPAQSPRAAMIRAASTAQSFFQSVLKREDLGQRARDLIARRSMTPEIVESFGVGASPDRWDGLLMTLQARNFDVEPFVAAGLLKRRESGSGMYDAFRNRLMFPIHDQIGRVIAFGARRIDEADDPKYLNSPESSIFDKSSTLYGLHVASRAIQRERLAIVTEGYMDAIACHQGGFANAVATLGTAMTRKHAAILKRMCDRVVLLFDSDDAGLRAADRAVEILMSEMLEVRVATLGPYTDAKDPDELLKRQGGDAVFRRVLDSATDLLEFRFARLRQRLAGAGVAALDRAVRDELARLAELGMNRLDPIRRQLIVKQLASATGLDARVISQSIPAGRPARVQGAEDPQTPESDPTPVQVGKARLGPQESIIGCVLSDPSLWTRLSREDRDTLASAAQPWDGVRDVATAMIEADAIGDEPGLASVLAHARDERARAVAVALQQRIERECGADTARVRSHFDACLASVRRDRAMREAHANTDPVARLAAMRGVRSQHGDDPRVFPMGGA